MKAIDLTGKVYGRLKVIKLDETAKMVNRKWICKCSCGNIVSVAGNNLKNGHTQKKQQNNRTNNRIIKYKNKEMNLQQFIKLTGLTESAVRGRLDRGWSVEDIANTPMMK